MAGGRRRAYPEWFGRGRPRPLTSVFRMGALGLGQVGPGSVDSTTCGRRLGVEGMRSTLERCACCRYLRQIDELLMAQHHCHARRASDVCRCKRRVQGGHEEAKGVLCAGAAARSRAR